MLKNIFLGLGFSFVAFIPSMVLAGESDYSVPYIGIGGGYSNVGEGLEFTFRFSKHFGVNYSFYDQEEDINIGSYNQSINILNRSFSVDYFPTGKNFYVTGAIIIPGGAKDISLNKSNYNISSIDSNLSSIDGEIDLGYSLTPYLGVGFKQNNKNGFGYFAEAGASYLKPDVSLSPVYNNSSYSNSNTEEAIKGIEKDIYKQLDDYKINYMIKLGFYYIF